MSGTAAILAATILAGLTAFQAALAAGAPLGHLAWGGQQTVLSPGRRIASAATIPIYVLIALILLDQAGVIHIVPDGVAQVSAWVVGGFFLLGVAANLASSSAPERRIMAPIAFLLAALAIIVAADL